MSAHEDLGGGILPAASGGKNWPPQVRLAGACLLLALVLAPAAHAQFDLFLVVGGVEQAAPAVYSFGSLYAGESGAAHFRLRNTSGAVATVDVLAVAGAGFTLTSPPIPVGLGPGDAMDLSVVFSAAAAGGYSAALRSDGIAILLTATVAPRLTYSVDPPSVAAFPGPLDFGSVVRSAAAQRRITMQNQTTLVLTVPAISVQGTDFALLGTSPSGQALQSGQGAAITIVFTPDSDGALQGTLTLGDRSYPLLGTGTDPPLPKPSFSALDLAQVASDQQPSLIVHFDAPARASGTGTATLDFRGPADPSIAFAAGGRSVTFPIAPGDIRAVLPFQTGTTAGVLAFTAQIGGSTAQQSVTIAAAPPGISTSQAVRSASSLSVSVAGFDNTRTLGVLSFTFYDADGTPVAPGAIVTDATAVFAPYFAASSLGGVFLLHAVFPVTGDAALVVSCEAALTNSAGSTRTQRTSF